MSESPTRYFRFTQSGEHYFGIIDTGPGRCRWQFLCGCGKEWIIVDEWDTEGLLRMQVPKTPDYTEVPEHEIIRLLLGGILATGG